MQKDGMQFRAGTAIALALAAAWLATTTPSLAESRARRTDEPRVVPPVPPLSVRYERNVGQCADEVRYTARGRGRRTFVTDDGLVLALAGPGDTVARLSMTIRGARTPSAWSEGATLPGRSHYFLGADPSAWRTNVESKAEVRARGVLPGVDVLYAGRDAPEYRFLVAAGTPFDVVELDFDGATSLVVDEAGDLRIATPAGVVRHTKPVAWQETARGRADVAARFEATKTGARIVVGPHDAALPLVVDPKVDFATYLGGSEADVARGVAVDADGSPVVVGTTFSSAFPVKGAYQSAKTGVATASEAFVSKFRPDGSDLVFSTYLGGNGSEQGRRVVLRNGAVWVAGLCDAPAGFPVIAGDPRWAGLSNDAFVVRLSGDGATLQYSTILGGNGNDDLAGFDVDAQGAFAVAMTVAAGTLPTANAYQSRPPVGPSDAYVAKSNASGSALAFATYLGGAATDQAAGLAFDSLGRVCVGGSTNSADFPTANAFQPTIFGTSKYDAFVARFPAAGGPPDFASYLGGAEDDFGDALAMDGDALVIAGHASSTDFPLVLPYQSTFKGQSDVFAARLASDGLSVAWSTLLGGLGAESPSSVAVNAKHEVCVVGATASADFPLKESIQQAVIGSVDAFVTCFAADGRSLKHSTYVGGSGANETGAGVAFDASAVVAVGSISTSDFVTKNPYQATRVGTGADGWVLRLDPAPTAPSQLSATQPYLNSVRLTWTDGSLDEDGFRVERRAVPLAEWVVVATVLSNVSTYLDLGLAFTSDYEYRVVAVGRGGDSRPSNVVSITTLADAVPPVPADVTAGAVSSGSIRVAWTPLDAEGVGVEISRSCEGSAFTVVAIVKAKDGAYYDDVPPDRACTYRVRALGALGNSAFAADVTVASRPSLRPVVAKGSLRDDVREAKDSLKVSGQLTFDVTGSPDGVFDPAKDGFELRLGAWADAPLFSVAGNDPRWKVKKDVAKWKSPKGAAPAVSLVVDKKRGRFSASVTKLTFLVAPTNPARLRLSCGNEAGAVETQWKVGKKGWTLVRN